MSAQQKSPERLLLEKLYPFLIGRNFVQGMPDMLRDMVVRYKQPPLTMHYRVAMQMTVNEYEYFFGLITELHEYMMGQTPIEKPIEVTIDEPVKEYQQPVQVITSEPLNQVYRVVDKSGEHFVEVSSDEPV